MQRVSSLKKSLVRLGMQAAAVLVVGVLVFSPFNQLLETPLAQAEVCPSETEWIGFGLGTHVCYGPNNADGSVHVIARISDKNYTGPPPAADRVEGGASSILDPLFDILSQIIYNFTVAVGGFFASVGAAFLNLAVHLSLSSTAYGLQFVTDGWGTARDVANMFFILILIYLAVTITLAADTGKTMHTLVRVLFIALIINFSFFITRVVIDAGNFTATQFYNQIDAGPPSKFVAGVQVTKDLSKSIMNAVGAESLLGTAAFENFKTRIGGPGEFVTILVICLFMGAVYAILAAIFVATGIKFVVRIAVLWLTIIASPLALVASTVPQFEEWFKKWRDNLISHAFFPVVFLFIFWLITRFAGDLNLSDAFKSLDPATNPSVGNGALNIVSLMADIGIRLGFLVAMLLLGLKVADELGVMGAKAVNNIGFGAPGFALRNTVGRLGYSVGQSRIMQGLAVRAPSFITQGLWRGATRLGKSNLDMRTPLGPLAGALGADIGKATKGGFKAGFDARVKRKVAEGEQFYAPTKAEEKDARDRAAQQYASLQTTLNEDIEAQKRAAQALKTAADNIADLERRNKRGTPEMDEATAARNKADTSFKTINARLGNVQERQGGINKKIENRAQALAPNLRNMYATSITRGIFGFTAANKKAADKIRKGKSEAERLFDALKEDRSSGGDSKEKKAEK